ncbi:MAG: hypothetical protein J0L66_15440 [Cytophagales bacterium]|nr:hypothetical protein [Cytophagales bacterium]
MSRSLLALTLLLVLALNGHAQKVKYKDLIELLNARNYEVAEPFLKRYLKENSDNISAYLYMGIVYQDKAQRNDILKQPEALLNNIDSAIFFLEKVAPLITEKELKRNDQNYQMYLRRDVRTAEFAIKLSDVTLDIETRVKNMRERKEKVKNLNNFFRAAERQYQATQHAFVALQNQYSTEKEFCLRLNESVTAELNRIKLTFDSSQLSFRNYRSVLESMGKVPYNQNVTLTEIADFKRDGNTEFDFFKGDLRLWDYARWSKNALDLYATEITPLRDHLVTYDIELNRLSQKLKQDSVSVKDELTKLLDRSSIIQLAKYDADPLPIGVFNMKMAELEYHSEKISNKAGRDTVGLVTRLQQLKKETRAVKKLDSLSARLLTRNFDKDAKDYTHFITKAYGTDAVLKNYIRSTHEFALRELAAHQAQTKLTEKAVRWLVHGNDSIPVVTDEPRSQYKPLVIVADRFTMGLKYVDSLATGYLFDITPIHKPKVAVSFPVEALPFKKRFLPVIKGMGVHPLSDLFIALVYSESSDKNGFPATLIKVDKTKGLVWSNNYRLPFTPSELLFSSDTGEIMIKLPTPTGEQKLFVVDKNGKKIQ